MAFIAIPSFARHPKLLEISLPRLQNNCALLMANLERGPVPLSRTLLEGFHTEERPWENIQGLEEQPVVYIGPSAHDLAMGKPMLEKPQLLEHLKGLGDSFFPELKEKLKLPEGAEFETWPTLDPWGLWTWNIVRYRETPNDPWKWIDSEIWNKPSGDSDPTQPVFPEVLDPKKREDYDLLFNNLPKDLYTRPSARSAVWTTPDGESVVEAWNSRTSLKAMGKLFKDSGLIAHIVYPPARFNGKPKSFIISVKDNKTHWPDGIDWVEENYPKLRPRKYTPYITEWPKFFRRDYLDHIKRASGEIPVISPRTGKVIDFTKMGSGMKDNQIIDYWLYLQQEHYLKKLKEINPFLETQVLTKKNPDVKGDPDMTIEMEYFNWEGIPQANMIVKFRGQLSEEEDRSMIYLDHGDKAIAARHFDKTGHKITTGGANDNGTATGALNIAGEMIARRQLARRLETLEEWAKTNQSNELFSYLKEFKDLTKEIDVLTGELRDKKLKERAALVKKLKAFEQDAGIGNSYRAQKSIELFHITGEEFPGSSLGARYRYSQMLKKKQQITGIIDMDMLGNKPKGSKIFQINPDSNPKSWKIAQAILDASKIHAGRYHAVVRMPFSRAGYDTQTDGAIARLLNLPHVTSNEDKGLNHRDDNNYHELSDVTKNLEMLYATSHVKTLIEAGFRLAGWR